MAEVKKVKTNVAFNANEIAKKVNARSNMVLLGATIPFLGLELAELEASIQRIFGRKGEAVVNSNLAAIKAGYEFAKNN